MGEHAVSGTGKGNPLSFPSGRQIFEEIKMPWSWWFFWSWFQSVWTVTLQFIASAVMFPHLFILFYGEKSQWIFNQIELDYLTSDSERLLNHRMVADMGIQIFMPICPEEVPQGVRVWELHLGLEQEGQIKPAGFQWQEPNLSGELFLLGESSWWKHCWWVKHTLAWAWSNRGPKTSPVKGQIILGFCHFVLSFPSPFSFLFFVSFSFFHNHLKI